MRTQKVLAVLCLVFAFPSYLLFLPGLPFTIQDHGRILRDLQYPGGEVSYYADRQSQLHNNWLALALYALSIFSFLGLVGIVVHRCRWLSLRIVWLAVCASGVGLAFFWRSSITPETLKTDGVLLAIYLPLLVSVLAFLGFIMSFIYPRMPFSPADPSA